MTKAEIVAKMKKLWDAIAKCPLCVDHHGVLTLCNDHNAEYKRLKEEASP